MGRCAAHLTSAAEAVMFISDDTKRTFVPLVLRLVLGLIFLVHGLDKVMGPGGGTDWATRMWNQQSAPPSDVLNELEKYKNEKPDDAQLAKEREDRAVTAEKMLQLIWARMHHAEMPTSLAFPAIQMAVAWGELVCGLALLVGLLTRVAAVLMVAVQIGAIYTVTFAKGFSFASGGGYEYNLALVAMCVAVAVAGGGVVSQDRLIQKRR
jgi:uncharacterized membrane protein YphA (DoxX/SURF4 family)